MLHLPCMKFLLLAAAVMLPVASFASTSGFIKFPDIEGEAMYEGHDKWIIVDSFQCGGTREGRKCEVEDFKFTKRTDSASIDLIVAFYTGEVFDIVELDVIRTGSTTGGGLGKERGYFNIKFYNATMTQVESAYSNGDDAVEETLEFSFDSAVLEYTDASGAATVEPMMNEC